MTDRDIVYQLLRTAEYFDSEDGTDRYVEAVAALDRMQARLNAMTPIVAALAIYGENVNLRVVIEKAQALNEAKP